MSKEGKPKKREDEPDITTNLLRQMGLAEDEIKSALDLAEKIEKKVEIPKKPEPAPAPATVPVPFKSDQASKQDLLNIIETNTTKLNYFQNVVAVQFILLIKKYKDKLISLENKLLEKNAEITSLEKKVLEKKAEVEKLSKKLEFLLK